MRPNDFGSCGQCCGTWTAPSSTPKSCGTSRCTALYEQLGGVLTPEVRDVDGRRLGRERHADRLHRSRPATTIRRRWRSPADWLHDYTGELFERGLPWCAGARELLDALAAERTSDGAGDQHAPSPHRACAEQHWARNTSRRSVCGDEVDARQARTGPLPAGGRRCWASTPRQCLAIEDSVTGTAAAEARGMPGAGGAQRRRGARGSRGEAM